jgi:hypothetical protein
MPCNVRRRTLNTCKSSLRGQARYPFVGLLRVLPEEFCIRLFALFGKEWPQDPKAIDNEVPNMLTNRPVAGIDESVFPEDVP